MNNEQHTDQQKLASRNIRLAVLLGTVAVTIYLAYIIVYYFKT